MFEEIDAISYVRTMSNGRTRPMLILCEAEGPEGPIDVVVKLSGGCEIREKALIREAIAAFFAIDLGLPVPCPYQVRLSQEFIATIPDTDARTLAVQSCPVAFGCHLVEGYATITKGITLNGSEAIAAGEIFALDVMLGNPDRCIDRPNCLYNGTSFAIFDHELAFSHFDVLFSQPRPWIEGDGDKMAAPIQNHIFFRALRSKSLDFARIKQEVERLTPERFASYRGALPTAWGNLGYIDQLISYLQEIQQNIDAIVSELRRVLV